MLPVRTPGDPRLRALVFVETLSICVAMWLCNLTPHAKSWSPGLMSLFTLGLLYWVTLQLRRAQPELLVAGATYEQQLPASMHRGLRFGAVITIISEALFFVVQLFTG